MILKNNTNNTGIILPLKETYTKKNFGAVSVWVSEYLKLAVTKKNIVFCRKSQNNKNYLTSNVNPIIVNEKYYTNQNYIRKINDVLIKKKINNVEIHNRPEYAIYLIDNNPNININLIFHNDPNDIRFSDTNYYKNKLLENCKKIVFVSKWVKKKFFENLNFNHKNNTEIIYNFINPLKKFPKKDNLIIFSGKLNKSKGFDIFANTITKILDKYNNWSAIVFGDDPREKFNINHDRLYINNWIDHKKLLKYYAKSSISIVNPTWNEPFGRTAMESASRGCAVITSRSGGLSETFENNIVLKENNSKNLFEEISKLIENKKYLKKIQLTNFKNVIHVPKTSVKKLDALRKNINLSNKIQNHKYRILHIGNFGLKVNHRLFNISISRKISNGLIRNGHDVINFDYRINSNKFLEKNYIDKQIVDILRNYNPDLILFGHNNILDRSTLLTIKEKFKCKTAIWYEDHVIKGDPNFKNNLNLLEKNHDLIDNYFITTSSDIIKTKIDKNKIYYMPIPVDPNLEFDKFYEYNKSKDLFFALSHGVNFGKLKKNTYDIRTKFIDELVSQSNTNFETSFDFNFLGLYEEQPKWNFDFINQIKLSKTALNLSRGGPNKYASSNRIALLMGNGILPFIHEDVRFQDFFDNDEIITYKNSYDLLVKLDKIKNDEQKIKKRSVKAKKSYFNYFENTIVTDFIIHKIFNSKSKYKYIWSK